MDPSYSSPAPSAGAGGQPQQTVFGAGDMQAPVSSGTGDIVLAPEKKSRKGVVIALIVGLLIIGGIFAAIFLMRGGGGSVNVNEDTKLAFNKYANYLLYGEDSDQALSEEYEGDEEKGIYAMLGAESDQAKPYADTLNALWDDFTDRTNNFSFGNDGLVRDDYGERVKFISVYLINNSKLDEEKIMTLAQTDASKTVDDYFKLYQGFNFEEAKEYVENGRLYFENLVRIMEIIKGLGCYSNEEGINDNGNCNEEAIFNDDEEYKNLDAYYLNMDRAIYDVADYLVIDSREISKLLNGDLQ
ncbi:hypothetical protein IJJ02_02600 [Candidatus Saccharibacteria bacterium]|nr:hypothetical protein [Candidatus Saccharibacteria bacterium]